MVTLVVITGASKGLGQRFATALTRHFVENKPGFKLRVVLLARSEEGLIETEQLVKQEAMTKFQLQFKPPPDKQQLQTSSSSSSSSTHNTTHTQNAYTNHNHYPSVNHHPKEQARNGTTQHTIHDNDATQINTNHNTTDTTNTNTICLTDILQVERHCIDLGNLDTIEQNLNDIINQLLPRTQYRRAILVNNAGTLGELNNIANLSNFTDFRKNIDLNVTSSLWLTSLFTKVFTSVISKQDTPLQPHEHYKTMLSVINVSSLCAIKPHNSLGIYCGGKAARNMFHKVLAEEHRCDPYVKVLNYAPGPCDTDMQLLFRESDTLDTSLKDFAVNSFQRNQLVHPNDTAECLARLLFDHTFTSGQHIDYYDVVDAENGFR